MNERQPDRESQENAASIGYVPEDQLRDGEARSELVRRALAGQDVYAYQKAGNDAYILWVRQADPTEEARFTPNVWAAMWRDGLQPEYSEPVYTPEDL